MAADRPDIKKTLEAEYDIPFVVKITVENGEPCYWITPENPGKEFFTVKISFKNKIRLSMEFIPEKYSANFIRSMEYQPESSRSLFISYARHFISKGAKCTFFVNRQPINLDSPNTWPSGWNSFEARITKMPVFSEGIQDYEASVNEWGSLMVGMVLSLTNIIPLEEEVKAGHTEGSSKQITVNRYERSPLNRKLCLSIHGYRCKICGFDFVEQYGDLGREFIHVHHITPVSEIGDDYLIIPEKDLIPVCPNCHAMLHRKNPPYDPSVLSNIVQHPWASVSKMPR